MLTGSSDKKHDTPRRSRNELNFELLFHTYKYCLGSAVFLYYNKMGQTNIT